MFLNPRIRPIQLFGLLLTLTLLINCLLWPDRPLSQRVPQPSTDESLALSSARTDAGRNAPARLPATSEKTTPERAGETYGQLPLSFEANQGQTDARVKFLSRGSGYSLFLTATEAALTLRHADSEPRDENAASPLMKPRNSLTAARRPKSAMLRMKLAGGNPEAEIEGEGALPGKANYFIGNDPARWRANVPTYARVRYREVYPGIDLVYHGNQRQLEYDFVVSPGASPRAIRLAFAGARRLRLDRSGDLVLEVAGGEVRQHKPFIYQEVNGERREVAGRFVIEGRREIGFEVAEYDVGRPLVIDPVLSYSTYLGGFGNERGDGIAVDSAGNAYITGTTDSGGSPPAAFPTLNPVQPNSGGGRDVFVTKINAAGSALVYSTYLGGSGFDQDSAIAVDSSGSAYVTGLTGSANFPTVNPLQATFGGGPVGFPRDAFVAKFNPSGSVLIYSTYLGGNRDEEGRGIAVDSSGNTYVTGITGSTNFPTANALQATRGGGSDAFITKFNATGSALIYSTYLGGSDSDEGTGIAADSSGNAYVIGETRSTNFPIADAVQATYGGGSGTGDAFVTKFNPAGSALVYSTYLGGSGGDGGNAIAVDGGGSAYVTGFANSLNFPTVNPLQPFKSGINGGGGGQDVFVSKISGPSVLQYSAASYSANEGDGRATITVTRTGDVSQAASVNYATVDDPAAVPCDPTITQPNGQPYPRGTAYARCDYATTIDTLSFAAGEREKSFTVPIIDDAHVEGAETLQLSLSNPQGVSLGAQSSATLTIADNDTGDAANPILSTPLFVRMQYLDFLSREPEQGEPWSAILNNCPDPFTGPEVQSPCDRILVSQSFFGSPEFRLKGFYVFTFYRVAFNRLAEYAEIVPDMRSVTGQTPEELFQKRAAFPAVFAQRQEFRQLYDNLSDAAYVNALLDRYRLQSITTPDPQNPEGGVKVTLTRADLINRLSATGAQALTRSQVLRAIVESDEVGAAEFTNAFVAMQYYGYLRRTPEPDGYNDWLRYLNANPNDSRTMVNGFMNSIEYRLRFGQP